MNRQSAILHYFLFWCCVLSIYFQGLSLPSKHSLEESFLFEGKRAGSPPKRHLVSWNNSNRELVRGHRVQRMEITDTVAASLKYGISHASYQSYSVFFQRVSLAPYIFHDPYK